MTSIAEVRQKFPQYADMSDDQLAGALHKKFYSDMPRADFDQKIGLQNPTANQARIDAAFEVAEQPQEAQQQFDGGSFGAFTEGAQNGATLGFGDEIYSAVTAPVRAAISAATGGDFDIAEAYSQTQQRLQDRQNAREAQHPVASIAGEIAGGLTTAGGLAKSGVTLMGRGLGTGGAITEGAAYGGVVGAGNAEQGERIQEGLTGAAFGGATAGVLDKVSGGIAKKAAQSEINKLPTPTIEELGEEVTQLYTRAEQAGVTIRPNAMNALGRKVMSKAGRINEKLRPKTAGIVEEFAALMNRPATLQEFDEVRQVIGQAMKRAEPQDVRTLSIIKDTMDDFAKKISHRDVTGDIRGFEFINQARGVYHRKAKAELIEDMFASAEIGTGQYTQSGIANTIGREFRKLAKNKKKMAMFTPDERRAINQIAMGKTSPQAANWLAKFAPRGVVSTMLSMGGGGLAGGPVLGAGLPLAGHFAAKSVDDATVRAAQALQGDMARGFVPQPVQLPHEPVIPLTGQISGLTLGRVGN